MANYQVTASLDFLLDPNVPERVDRVQGNDAEKASTDRSDDSQTSEKVIVYTNGTQFWLIGFTICVVNFMTNLEVPIINTALVAITDDLGGFDLVGWVVASYLLGYIAVIVIFSKFSDIFSRKIILLLSIAIFIIFSAACAAAQTVEQLIVFRAFQGVGGGGCFSLCNIMISELVRPEKIPEAAGNLALTSALALLLGPILGGAISENTTWRWVFIIIVPIMLPAFIVGWIAIPEDFPYHHPDKHVPRSGMSILRRVDIPGTILILLAAMALTAGFEEADRMFPWRSAYVITLLTVGGLLWIALLLWERYVTNANGIREPVLPWRFFKNREMMGVLLNFIFLGGPTLISMYIIPQRFQLVYGTSALDAGVRLIPFTVLVTAGALFSSRIAGKFKIPPIYLLFVGSVFQIIGFALLGTLPTALEIPNEIYGYQILAGWGCGMNFSLLFVLIPFVNEERDRAVGLGAGAQFRTMGASMILAISNSVFNSIVRPRFEELLGTADVTSSTASLATLSLALQNEVREVLAEGYNSQILVLCVSAALQVPVTMLMWRKKQVVV